MRGEITVVGLGPGDPGLVTRAAWEILAGAPVLHLRTKAHPLYAELSELAPVETFDSLYEAAEDFEEVYAQIVESLVARAGTGQPVVYAVPGDPFVGEATVGALRRRASRGEITMRVVHGVSFVEPCLAQLGLDALDGLFVGDAIELARGHNPPFPPSAAALIGQLHDRMLAADVKLTLMNQYPEDHPVILIHRAGTGGQTSESLPLFELDRGEKIGGMTALFVPALALKSSFESLQETIAHLRAPDGCPWDREQTHQSLRLHVLEECYEVLQAIDDEDMEALREELGDLLLQIVLQAQIASEGGHFLMPEVIMGINTKLTRRHPHVFGDSQLEDVEDVLHRWEELKAEERRQNGLEEGALAGVPQGLPALAQAEELQSRAARVGFDWPRVEGVLDKIREELAELAQAASGRRTEEELGDLLFAMVNYARWRKVDPEAALRSANRRFRRRFAQVESMAREQGQELATMSLEEMDRLWDQAKRA